MTSATYEVVIPAGLSHDEWALNRNALDGIGASEAAAAMGMDPWLSPFALYLEKTGELDPEPANEAMLWGLRVEGLVCDEFEDRHDELCVSKAGATYRSIEWPWMLASLDRELNWTYTDGAPGVLEVKNTSAFLATDWHDRPPDRVVIQVQQQLAVTGYAFAWVAALIGGNRYVEFAVERDEAIIANVIETTRAFWQRVLDRKPPPIDGTDSTKDALGRLYPGNGETVELRGDDDEEARFLITARRDEKLVIANAERNIERYENRLRGLIGDAEIAVTADAEPQVLYTYKKSERAAYVVKASSGRRFHFPKEKD